MPDVFSHVPGRALIAHHPCHPHMCGLQCCVPKSRLQDKELNQVLIKSCGIDPVSVMWNATD